MTDGSPLHVAIIMDGNGRWANARGLKRNAGHEAGEQAAFEANVHNLHPELVRTLGRLKFRTSYGQNVLKHALEVSHLSGVMAAELGVDVTLAKRAGLLHDLGKAKTHEIEHGKTGAELGKALGLPDEITAIMEKHIRGGLTEPEAKELGLPVKDYTLRRLEERIVIYADRLVDIITDGIVEIGDEKEAEDRFEEILRSYPKYGKNEITLNRYLGYHREIQGLMKKA